MTGNLDMRNNRIYYLPTPTGNAQPTPKSYVDSNFLKLSGGTMSGTLAMGNNKITGLAEATANGDGVNLRTLNTCITKPSDHTNRFAYLINPTNDLLQWTDSLSDSIALNSIGDLNTTSGNYHTYNKKVINASIKKNSEGGYKWKLAIQCLPLQKDKEYTLCLEILTIDYQLWHKSVITVDKTTGQGVTVKRWHVNKYTHEYKTSSNQTVSINIT